jgi:phosphoribosylanthranilate isomerase
MLIKICGITSPETAIACFEAGASIIGLVYYPPSPRHVDIVQIGEILDAVKPFGGRCVLVVVDQLPDKEVVSKFTLLQSYGTIKDDISMPQIRVVKDFDTFTRLLELPTEPKLPPYYALEMSKGTLPGGNGAAWDWSIARPFCERYPTFIAGGITPENVADVIRQANPFGIDVSSGVESSPGVKNRAKIELLVKGVLACGGK